MQQSKISTVPLTAFSNKNQWFWQTNPFFSSKRNQEKNLQPRSKLGQSSGPLARHAGWAGIRFDTGRNPD
jgi:hypothetical protein